MTAGVTSPCSHAVATAKGSENMAASRLSASRPEAAEWRASRCGRAPRSRSAAAPAARSRGRSPGACRSRPSGAGVALAAQPPVRAGGQCRRVDLADEREPVERGGRGRCQPGGRELRRAQPGGHGVGHPEVAGHVAVQHHLPQRGSHQAPSCADGGRGSRRGRRRGRGWRPTPRRAPPSGRGCASAGRGAPRHQAGPRARSRRRSRESNRSPVTGAGRARAATSAARTTWPAGWPTACLLPWWSSSHEAATAGNQALSTGSHPAVGAEQRVPPGRRVGGGDKRGRSGVRIPASATPTRSRTARSSRSASRPAGRRTRAGAAGSRVR